MATTYTVAGYSEHTGQKVNETFTSEAQASKVANHLSELGWSISLSTNNDEGAPQSTVVNHLDFVFGKTVF